MESDITTSSNEDNNDDLLSLAEDLCIVSALLACRTVRITKSRLSWSIHIQMLLHENQFHVMYRMTFDSFNYLLQLLSPRLNVNERFARMSSGAPFLPEYMLSCIIRFLAGGSYHDIRQTGSISKSSFYCGV